jgi:hypothetical protein
MVPGLVCGDFSTGAIVRLVSARCEDAAATSAAWQARVDLAAADRLADSQGFGEGIFNHFTLATPDTDDRYLQIPFGLHWSEVTASCSDRTTRCCSWAIMACWWSVKRSPKLMIGSITLSTRARRSFMQCGRAVR